MKKQTQKNKNIALMGVLTAILLLMAYTPIGYLRYGAISISFLMIPVALGGIVLGPWAGAALGTIFGITSFAQCFGSDAFGTFLMDINPFFTFVMCVVARALAGFLAGLIANGFKAVKKKFLAKEKPGTALAVGLAGYSVTGLCAALLNTALFVGTLLLFFWNNGDFIAKMNEWGFNTSTIVKFFVAFVGTNALVEAIAAFFITGAVASALYKARLIDVPETKKDLGEEYILEGDVACPVEETKEDEEK